MTQIIPRETDLSTIAREVATTAGMQHLVNRSSGGDNIIHVELGPQQDPPRIRILRSAWPTVTALNFAEGREFHMRLRRHSPTGIFLVYGSVTLSNKTVRQRGHLCRTLAAIEAVIPILRRELELEPAKAFNP